MLYALQVAEEKAQAAEEKAQAAEGRARLAEEIARSAQEQGVDSAVIELTTGLSSHQLKS